MKGLLWLTGRRALAVQIRVTKSNNSSFAPHGHLAVLSSTGSLAFIKAEYTVPGRLYLNLAYFVPMHRVLEATVAYATLIGTFYYYYFLARKALQQKVCHQKIRDSDHLKHILLDWRLR